MHIEVDRERCCGAGMCVLTAPEVFDQDDTGIVMLLTEQPDEADHAAVREAGESCPSLSITVTG